MRQRQRLQKKLRFVLRPLRNGRGPPSAGEHSHHCDDDDADERMFDINRSAWVFQLVKVVDDVFDADALDLRHNFLLQELCKRYNPKDWCRKKPPMAPVSSACPNYAKFTPALPYQSSHWSRRFVGESRPRL